MRIIIQILNLNNYIVNNPHDDNYKIITIEEAKQIHDQELAKEIYEQQSSKQEQQEKIKDNIKTEISIIIEKDEDLQLMIKSLMEIVMEYELTCDKLLGFIFEKVFDENIIEQVLKYKNLLSAILVKSSDKDLTKKQLLKYIVNLVGKSAFSEILLEKTSHIIKSFYDTDLLDKDTIIQWGKTKSKSKTTNKVREKALPLIKWLKEADEESD